jgi:hypothetical protein
VDVAAVEAAKGAPVEGATNVDAAAVAAAVGAAVDASAAPDAAAVAAVKGEAVSPAAAPGTATVEAATGAAVDAAAAPPGATAAVAAEGAGVDAAAVTDTGAGAAVEGASVDAAMAAPDAATAAAVAEPASSNSGVRSEFEALLTAHAHDRSIWEAAVSASELRLSSDARAAAVLWLCRRALDARTAAAAVDGGFQAVTGSEGAHALSLDDRLALTAAALAAMDSYGSVQQMWEVVELQTGLLREVLQATAQSRKRAMDTAVYGQEAVKHQAVHQYGYHHAPANPQAAAYYHQPQGYDYSAYYQQHGYYGYG